MQWLNGAERREIKDLVEGAPAPDHCAGAQVTALAKSVFTAMHCVGGYGVARNAGDTTMDVIMPGPLLGPDHIGVRCVGRLNDQYQRVKHDRPQGSKSGQDQHLRSQQTECRVDANR